MLGRFTDLFLESDSGGAGEYLQRLVSNQAVLCNLERFRQLSINGVLHDLDAGLLSLTQPDFEPGKPSHSQRDTGLLETKLQRFQRVAREEFFLGQGRDEEAYKEANDLAALRRSKFDNPVSEFRLDLHGVGWGWGALWKGSDFDRVLIATS